MPVDKKHKNLKANSAEFIIRMAAPLLWGSAILLLSLTSSPPQIPGILGWDKLLHAGAYGLLTVLIAQFLMFAPLRTGRPWWQAGCAAICYGGLIEIMQLLAHTGRTAEWWDLFADAAGAFLAYVIFRKFTVSV